MSSSKTLGNEFWKDRIGNIEEHVNGYPVCTNNLARVENSLP